MHFVRGNGVWCFGRVYGLSVLVDFRDFSFIGMHAVVKNFTTPGAGK